MKTLTTLIKLHKRNLDELRRRMASLENQKTQLQLLIIKLQEELAQEIKLAGSHPEMAHFFGGFAKRIQRRQDEVTAEIRSLDQQMKVLSEEIAAAFSEL